MKNRIGGLSGLALFLFVACSGPEAPTQERIPSAAEMKDSLEHLAGLLEKAQGDVIDLQDTARTLVRLSKDFVSTYPDDENAASILFRAADVARGLREYGQAIELWGKVWRSYSGYDRAPDALFLQGFTFDADLRDAANAQKYYQLFLQKFPEHPLAAQAEQLLQVVSEQPEELIKKFQSGEAQ
ncbi:MAG: tetratricopeptide repeat protein [Bacteroidota bacterium]